VVCSLLLIWVLMLIQATPNAAADEFKIVKSLIGPHDSL
jgi:hypothetical protein